MNHIKFSVLNLLQLELKEQNILSLQCESGQDGLDRLISTIDLNRPGLALSGFFDVFAFKRIQLIGRGEHAFLTNLFAQQTNAIDRIQHFFSYPIPCCIFSHNLMPPKEFLHEAKKSSCPILRTPLSSTELSIRLLRILSNVFAPKVSMHGVLIDVFGIGMLITGKSGIGKSEIGLELIERGHRLVADDVVEITRTNGNFLVGRSCNHATRYHMEIRGIGIINIAKLFGVGSIRTEKEVQLVVQLEEWDAYKQYDRIGSTSLYTEILNVHIPFIEIPVKPYRNVPIILEAAAKNERLKKMGYFSAKEFNQYILKSIDSNNTRAPYYHPDDTY